jgi:hypothetical protein
LQATIFPVTGAGLNNINICVSYVKIRYMIKPLLTTFLVSSIFFTGKAQINLTGATTNQNTGLNYDNVNDRLFARNSTFDSLNNYTGNKVVQIDTLTGAVITLAGIVGLEKPGSGFSAWMTDWSNNSRPAVQPIFLLMSAPCHPEHILSMP